MKTVKIYKCNTCGNIIFMINDSGAIPFCCGKQMIQIEANKEDASNEKHVPVITKEGRNVNIQVGETEHPMNQNHHIEWILLETDKGYYTVNLSPDDKPLAQFTICEDESLLAAYAFCNIHGLWVKKYFEI